jgi:mitochondrial splicing suppressor protein 51
VASLTGLGTDPQVSTRQKPPAKRSLAQAAVAERGPASESGFTANHAALGRVLEGDNLFHSYTRSPIPDIRHRAAFMRQHAYCPHPDHRPTRLADSGTGRDEVHTGSQSAKHVDFECPDCGIPVYCSKEHWQDHYEAHLEVCDTLRQINEDDHDLRSGRDFPEFQYAGPQIEESLVNMENWDTLLYTRLFEAINDDRSMRQATRVLTYPVTVGSILHELSPYNIRRGGRLTVEGLKSFSGKV